MTPYFYAARLSLYCPCKIAREMINKRRLIRNLLANTNECSFYDKKETIDITTAKGKARFVKHVCALSNSNPSSPSYLIIGISDANEITGTDFMDDAKIQDLCMASLRNCPRITFENIPFSSLPKNKSVGLLTIQPQVEITSFMQTIDNIRGGTTYHRIGSKSVPVEDNIQRYEENRMIVEEVIKYSKNSILELLDGVFEFFKTWDAAYDPRYIVFKEQYVLCWSGYRSGDFYSEVDIRIVNEGVRLFYSGSDDVKIKITDDLFEITEYAFLGFGENFRHYQYEATRISFDETGSYSVEKSFNFEIPKFGSEEMEKLYLQSKLEGEKMREGNFEEIDWGFCESISMNFFLCYLNGIDDAKKDFYDSNKYVDGAAAEWFSRCERILQQYEIHNRKI